MQFLYANGDIYNFMNMETYEQIELSKDQIGEDVVFLKEGLNVEIVFYEGEMLGIQLPEKLNIKLFKLNLLFVVILLRMLLKMQ